MYFSTDVTIASLRIALRNWARAVGSASQPYDSAFKLVQLHCLPEDRPFWNGPYASIGMLVGLVDDCEFMPDEDAQAFGQRRIRRNHHAAALAEKLGEDDVVAFRNSRDDGVIRLIDRKRRNTPAEIHGWVRSPQAALGHACRCCGVVEPPLSTLLGSADPFRDRGFHLVNGRREYRSDIPRVHGRCINQWWEWSAIADAFDIERKEKAA